MGHERQSLAVEIEPPLVHTIPISEREVELVSYPALTGRARTGVWEEVQLGQDSGKHRGGRGNVQADIFTG